MNCMWKLNRCEHIIPTSAVHTHRARRKIIQQCALCTNTAWATRIWLYAEGSGHMGTRQQAHNTMACEQKNAVDSGVWR